MMPPSPIGVMYFYDKDIEGSVAAAIRRFEKKYGYKPTQVHIRMSEMNRDAKFSIDAVKRVTGIQPNHFILFPLILKRNPRIAPERVPA